MKPLKNIVVKWENVGNQYFLLFPQYFFSLSKINPIIRTILKLSSANAFNLGKHKIFCVVMSQNVGLVQIESLCRWQLKIIKMMISLFDRVEKHCVHILFTCSRTVYCVPEHCSGMLERNISAQFYCSVLNGVFSQHCSFKLKYDSSFHHLESHGNLVSRCGTPRII